MLELIAVTCPAEESPDGVIPYTDNVLAPLCKGSHDGTLYRLVNEASARRAVWTCAVALAVPTSLLPLGGTSQLRIPAESFTELEQTVALFQAGNYEAARRQTEPLGRRHPEVAEVQHLLAIVLDLNRRPEEAQLLPGEIQFELQKWPAAVEVLQQAVRLAPDHRLAHYRLGLALPRTSHARQAQRWSSDTGS